MLQRGLGLVYGAASIGLMGVIADCVLEGGGDVTGVIPEALAKKEVVHENLTQLHVVDSMHERKALMATLADGFIALPGGLGTLEELLEILTWAQLGIHSKPCAVLNSGGYYDKLVAFLNEAVTEGFIRPENIKTLLVENDPVRLLDRMENYQAHEREPLIDITET